MLAWILDNLASIIICVLLSAAVAAIIVHMIKNRKKGKTSCGGGCGGCPMSGSCRKH